VRERHGPKLLKRCMGPRFRAGLSGEKTWTLRQAWICWGPAAVCLCLDSELSCRPRFRAGLSGEKQRTFCEQAEFPVSSAFWPPSRLGFSLSSPRRRGPMPPAVSVCSEAPFCGNGVWVPAFAGTTSWEDFYFPRTAPRESGDPSFRRRAFAVRRRFVEAPRGPPLSRGRQGSCAGTFPGRPCAIAGRQQRARAPFPAPFTGSRGSGRLYVYE
jgi:hypothetical protein